jgi:hypothetical protein
MPVPLPKFTPLSGEDIAGHRLDCCMYLLWSLRYTEEQREHELDKFEAYFRHTFE